MYSTFFFYVYVYHMPNCSFALQLSPRPLSTCKINVLPPSPFFSGCIFMAALCFAFTDRLLCSCCVISSGIYRSQSSLSFES